MAKGGMLQVLLKHRLLDATLWLSYTQTQELLLHMRWLPLVPSEEMAQGYTH